MKQIIKIELAKMKKLLKYIKYLEHELKHRCIYDCKDSKCDYRKVNK